MVHFTGNSFDPENSSLYFMRANHNSDASKGFSEAGQKLAGCFVARISTVPFFVANQLMGQINYVARQGASVVVVSSDGPELATIRWVKGVSHVAIDIPRSISPLRDFFGFLNLLLLFSSGKFKIVHSTTPKAGLLTAIASFICCVPVRLHTFTGQPWVEMHGIRKWLAFTSDRVIGILNTHCYADSLSQKNFIIEKKIINPRRLSVIGSGSLAGVDIERFNSSRITFSERKALLKKYEIPEGEPIILFLGRITPDKGVGELLEAFKIIKSTINDAHLLFVGPLDSKSGVGESVDLIACQGIQGIHFIGQTDIPELYLSIANVLCLPSYREGFGTVIIEAAAMGIPSVGTKIYGLTDAVVDGVTGLLVPPKNVEALAIALSTLLGNEVLQKKMGCAARLRAIEKFNSTIINKMMVDEYCKRLQERNT